MSRCKNSNNYNTVTNFVENNCTQIAVIPESKNTEKAFELNKRAKKEVLC